jgi:hypothetical protein
MGADIPSHDSTHVKFRRSPAADTSDLIVRTLTFRRIANPHGLQIASTPPLA